VRHFGQENPVAQKKKQGGDIQAKARPAVRSASYVGARTPKGQTDSLKWLPSRTHLPPVEVKAAFSFASSNSSVIVFT
jgi:hypothetical protein